MSRRRILIGIGASMALVAVGLVVFVLTRPQPTIDPATASRIARGMTEAEVDAVVGAPEGSYGRGAFLGRQEFDIFKSIVGSTKRKRWSGEQGIILVWFDSQGRVMAAEYVPAP